MAFPTIPTVAGGRVLTTVQANTTATRTFPSLTSLTKNSGDLLIAIVIGYQSSTTNAQFGSWGGGFTEFHDSGTSTTLAIGMAYKWSTGSETGTFTVTQSATITGHAAMILMSIPGAHASTPPEAGGRGDGTGSPPNPTAFNPAGWDVEDTLWIQVIGSGETSTTGSYTGIASAEAAYSDYVDTGISGDVVGGVEAAVAFLQAAQASEDAAAPSVDTSNARSSALTIAVRPAVGAIDLAPSPVALDLGDITPALALSLALAPSPVALSPDVLGATADFPPVVVTPSPVALALSDITPALALSLALAPPAVPLDLGDITPALALSLALTPSPVNATLGDISPALALSLALAPSPVATALGVVPPDVSSDSGPIFLVPAPVALVLGDITPTLALGAVELTPAPVALAASNIAPALDLSLGLTPDPVPLTLVALPFDMGIFLTPDPVVLALGTISPAVSGPITIVSGSDHQFILDSIAFYEAFDALDEMGRRTLLRDFLLTHGGQETINWNRVKVIVGAPMPVRLTAEDVDGD